MYKGSWFLSDSWSHLVYGEPKGWVAQGRDVDGLLDALQGVYSSKLPSNTNKLFKGPKTILFGNTRT